MIIFNYKCCSSYSSSTSNSTTSNYITTLNNNITIILYVACIIYTTLRIYSIRPYGLLNHIIATYTLIHDIDSTVYIFHISTPEILTSSSQRLIVFIIHFIYNIQYSHLMNNIELTSITT